MTFMHTNDPIPARHIDKQLRAYWVAEGLVEIKGFWPFQKAYLTAKALKDGLPNAHPRDLCDFMFPH